MKTFPKFFSKTVSILTFLGFFGLALMFFYLSNGFNIQGLFPSEIKHTQRYITAATLPSSEYHGWVAYWDEKNSLKIVEEHTSSFKSISPMWYQINSQGSLTPTPHTLETELKVSVQHAKLQLIPTITNNGDPAKTSVLLNNPEMKERLIKDLIHLAQDSGYQGYDIDFEEINPLDQPQFTTFIQDLSSQMHKEKLLVTVSVHAQTGNTTDREVARAYDLVRLSEAADFIKVMAYDFHYANSSAGAVTPLTNLEQVLDFVSMNVPMRKIIMGLPTYGYDWNTSDGGKAEVVTFEQAQVKIASFGGTIKRDSASQSLLAEYQLDGKNHQIWIEDTQTINAFIKKSRSYGIYQFSFWRVGAEDPKLWNNLTSK